MITQGERYGRSSGALYVLCFSGVGQVTVKALCENCRWTKKGCIKMYLLIL